MARIALVSDITPVPLTSGPMVLYRHFMRMQHHKLLVVSGEIPEPDPAQRHWEVIRLPRRLRWLQRPTTRGVFEEVRAREIARELRDTLKSFRPDVILSVWTSEYLLAAARLSKELRVPLVLICHDDFESMLPFRRHVRWWARRRLRAIYRGASARLCVSEPMCETFERRYGAPAVLMYPIPDALCARPITRRLASGAEPLRVGTFGNIGGGIATVVLAVADALARVGGTLHFSSTVRGSIRDRLSAHPNVVDCGTFISPAAVQAYFRDAIDVVLIPQSFQRADATAVALQFPSKLAESSQLDLPLLVVAPPYASAARWAASNPSATISCQGLQADQIAAALERLGNPERRREIGVAVREVARSAFHPASIHQKLEEVLYLATSGKHQP